MPGGELLDVFDMPCLNDGPGARRNVNGPLLAEIIAKSHASRAYIELVGVRPGEGAVGAFSFGRSRGVVEGVLAALGVRLVTFHVYEIVKQFGGNNEAGKAA